MQRLQGVERKRKRKSPNENETANVGGRQKQKEEQKELEARRYQLESVPAAIWRSIFNFLSLHEWWRLLRTFKFWLDLFKFPTPGTQVIRLDENSYTNPNFYIRLIGKLSPRGFTFSGCLTPKTKCPSARKDLALALKLSDNSSLLTTRARLVLCRNQITGVIGISTDPIARELGDLSADPALAKNVAVLLFFKFELTGYTTACMKSFTELKSLEIGQLKLAPHFPMRPIFLSRHLENLCIHPFVEDSLRYEIWGALAFHPEMSSLARISLPTCLIHIAPEVRDVIKRQKLWLVESELCPRCLLPLPEDEKEETPQELWGSLFPELEKLVLTTSFDVDNQTGEEEMLKDFLPETRKSGGNPKLRILHVRADEQISHLLRPQPSLRRNRLTKLQRLVAKDFNFMDVEWAAITEELVMHNCYGLSGYKAISVGEKNKQDQKKKQKRNQDKPLLVVSFLSPYQRECAQIEKTKSPLDANLLRHKDITWMESRLLKDLETGLVQAHFSGLQLKRCEALLPEMKAKLCKFQTKTFKLEMFENKSDRHNPL